MANYPLIYNTIREIVRQRLFSNVLIFGVGIVLLAVTVSTLTYGEPARSVRSIGLSGVEIIGGLAAVLAGVGIIHRELDRKTIAVVLTRPIGRPTFVVSRYFGLVLTVWAVMVLLFLLVEAAVWVLGGAPSLVDGGALILAAAKAAVLAGAATAMSAYSTPTLSAGLCFGFWIAAESVDDFAGLAAAGDDPGMSTLATVFGWVIPSFERASMIEAAVYAAPMDWARLGLGVLHCSLYSVFLVAIAAAILTRRDIA